jgi:hypothetical protein
MLVYHELINMETAKTKQFLVLVPHRDTRLVLKNYSKTLLKKGFSGAYCFPWAAPLALLSRPLNPQDLKNIAHAIRKSAIKGKFNAEEAKTIPFPLGEKDGFLYGPSLDLSLPPDFSINGISHFYTKIVIGACLLQDDKNTGALPCPPKLAFSAAAVANMVWQPVSISAEDTEQTALGYKWKTGKLFWLPKKQAQASSLN